MLTCYNERAAPGIPRPRLIRAAPAVRTRILIPQQPQPLPPAPARRLPVLTTQRKDPTITTRRPAGLALFLSAALAALLLIGHPASAGTPALSFAPGAIGVEDNAADATGSAAGSYSLGFEFTANSSVFVTSLGYFNDPSFNPASPFNSVTLNPTPTGSYVFADSHDVGLYQVFAGVGGGPETGTLLASTTITSVGTHSGDFLYSAIGPVQLTAGGQYVLAGVTGANDPYVFAVQDSNGNSALSTSSAITYGQDRYASGSTLTFPSSADAGSEPGFFGPNMQTSPVPEASTTVSLGLMLGLGLLGLGLSARRRVRRSN